ncbi:MAG: HugZ family protein [Flavobacteriaceae bacterium]
MNIQDKVEKAQKKNKPLQPKVKELMARCKSVILATIDSEGIPNSSYVPHVVIDNKLYVLVSFMARHTKNLRDMKKVSVMFIEDEADTKQIYARERLTIDGTTSQIERGTEMWSRAVTGLTESHGKILDILTGMDDFIMIEITPLKGAYVNGFGSAYFVDTNFEVINHRNDINHTVRKEEA